MSQINNFYIYADIPLKAKKDIIQIIYVKKELKSKFNINRFTLFIWKIICYFTKHNFKHYNYVHITDESTIENYKIFYCERCLLIESEKMHLLHERKMKIKTIL
jgi:hypothetical protein